MQSICNIYYCPKENIVHLPTASGTIGHTFLLEPFPSITLWIFLLFSVSDFTLLNPPNYFDHKYYSVLWLIFPCLFFVYNLFLADIIKFIALYTLYVRMTSTFIFLVLTIFLTYISICIPIPIPLPVFTPLLCLSTLKISNHWSNRHITVQNNY